MKKKPTEKRSKLFGKPEALLVEESVVPGTPTPPPIDLGEARVERRRPRPLLQPPGAEVSAPTAPTPQPPAGPAIIAAGPEADELSEEVLPAGDEEDDEEAVAAFRSLPAVASLRLKEAPRSPDEDETILVDTGRPRPSPAIRLRTAAKALGPTPSEFAIGDLVETVRARLPAENTDEQPLREEVFDAGVIDEGDEPGPRGFIPLRALARVEEPIPEDHPALRGGAVTAPTTAPPRMVNPTLSPRLEPNTEPPAEEDFPEPVITPRARPPSGPVWAPPPRPTAARLPTPAAPRAPAPRLPAAPVREPPPNRSSTVATVPARAAPRAPAPPPPSPAREARHAPANVRPVSGGDGTATLLFGVCVGLMVAGAAMWAWPRLNAPTAPPTAAPREADANATVAEEGGPTAEGVPPTEVAAPASDPSAPAAPPVAEGTAPQAPPPEPAEPSKAAATTASKQASTPSTTSTSVPPPQVGKLPPGAVSLATQTGYVRVASDKKCLVIVDGRQRGYAPGLGPFELPTGSHEVRCVLPGSGTSQQASVRVDAGALRGVQFQFDN